VWQNQHEMFEMQIKFSISSHNVATQVVSCQLDFQTAPFSIKMEKQLEVEKALLLFFWF